MHPAESYVGWVYDAATADCADLVAQVQRELFDRDVRLPNGRKRGAKGMAAMGAVARAYAIPTDSPTDGDLVLMREPGHSRPSHAGVFFHIAGEGWVLHATDRLGGCGLLHRVRDLPSMGCFIEAYYAWA